MTNILTQEDISTLRLVEKMDKLNTINNLWNSYEITKASKDAIKTLEAFQSVLKEIFTLKNFLHDCPYNIARIVKNLFNSCLREYQQHLPLTYQENKNTEIINTLLEILSLNIQIFDVYYKRNYLEPDVRNESEQKRMMENVNQHHNFFGPMVSTVTAFFNKHRNTLATTAVTFLSTILWANSKNFQQYDIDAKSLITFSTAATATLSKAAQYRVEYNLQKEFLRLKNQEILKCQNLLLSETETYHSLSP